MRGEQKVGIEALPIRQKCFPLLYQHQLTRCYIIIDIDLQFSQLIAQFFDLRRGSCEETLLGERESYPQQTRSYGWNLCHLAVELADMRTRGNTLRFTFNTKIHTYLRWCCQSWQLCAAG